MTDLWIDDAILRLRGTNDATAIKTANAIKTAKENGALIKIVSGINKNSITLIKIK